ncbi:MAG: hypothetical protein IPM29_06555 [Planctomycetes bacterium]|nr:hypothetical protein [Planctomycetota bacterium]
MHHSLRLLALAGALLAPATLAPAQGCGFGDDGFASVACCSPANPTLPNFPGFALSAQYACIKDCSLEAQFPIRVQIQNVPVLCDYAIIPITVLPGTTASPGFSGGLLAKYARTWLEPDATGAPGRQVWRFLVNGDLTPTGGAQPCPVPPLPAGVLPNFHGHIDYACELNAAGQPFFSAALSLSFLPGCIEHTLFSCYPLFGPPAHNDRSYHIVAPGNFAFVPTPIPAGPMLSESVRSARFAPIYTCVGEARMLQGGINLVSRDCLCVPILPPFSHPWVHYNLTGVIGCMGLSAPFSSVPTAAPLPPLTAGMTALALGMWTGAPGTFPGNRELATHWGLINYPDPCNPGDVPFHFVQGVGTSGAPGFLFSTPGLVANTFLDLSDMQNPSSLWGGPIFPAWGCLYISKRVFNLNL